MIRAIEQLGPSQLTAILHQSGALEQGQVVAIAGDDTPLPQGQVATVSRLRAHYSDEATGLRPRDLLLKLSRADLHPELMERTGHETQFYRDVLPASPGVPAPRCFAAGSDAESAFLLLEDLSASHFMRPPPIPPFAGHCEQVVGGLARLHATWWNHPRLGRDIGQRLTWQTAEASLRRLHEGFTPFADFLGDALLTRQYRTLERILASSFLLRLSQRLVGLESVTLVHGDVHNGNTLLPRAPGDDVVFVDWQLWGINLGTHDLAFWMALHWPAQRRAVLEKPLLGHYYSRLLALGVSGYSWADLWDDYRRSVIVAALIPIGQFRQGSPAGVVWYGLQHSLDAFEDLECVELL